MKPLKLTMVAFGPYAQKVELDFTKGLRENIFVITGNTGAGKTTIFDAICYALYGATSDNNGRQALELRSHFADEQAEKTYVEFEFSIRGQAYRVKRTPPQLRKKARGSGVTEEKHTVEFKKLDEESVSITRVEDVERELGSLLGLSLEQFKRIVMLPQGEFREFLQDKSSDKTVLLRRLFDTAFYDDLTEYLGKQAKALSESVKELETKIYTNLTHTVCEQESELAELIAAKGYIPDVITALDGLIHELSQGYEQSMDSIKLVGAQLLELEKSVHQAREQQMFNEERIQLETRLQELNTRAEYIQALNKNCSLAELAEKNLATEAIFKQTGREVQELEAELVKAKQELPALCAQAAADQKLLLEIPKQELQLGVVQNSLALLNSYLPKIKQIETLQRSLAVAGKDLELQEQALNMAEKKVALDMIEKQCTGLRELYHKLSQVNKLKQTSEQLQIDYVALEEQIKTFERDLHNKRDLLLNSAAINLARALKAGDKCPVCGATEHPELAAIHSDIPTKSEIDKLDKELSSLKKTLDNNLRQSMDLQQEIGKIETVVAALCAREDIRLLLGEAVPTLEQIGSLGIQLTGQADAITAEFSARGLKAAELSSQQVLTDNVQALKMSINTEQGQLSILLEDVPAEQRSTEKVIQEIQALELKVEQDKQTIQTQRNMAEQSNLAVQKLNVQIEGMTGTLQNKVQALGEWQGKFDEFLLANFAGILTEYEQGKAEIANIATLKKQIQEHQKSLDNCNLRLYELSKLILPGEFELTAIESELMNKRELVQSLQEKTNSLKHSLDNNKRILNTVKADFVESGERLAQHALLSKLFRLANGGAAHRMPLETFVLSTYFDDILAHANVRLQKMTDNRYLLVRRTSSAGRGFKGLDIDVDDAHTGKLRSVSTLSGGESFKASLALALGLADVVQENAGGIQLDTMLIDEGFGTLDEESLDTAIDTLMELQEHGRVIGVISHVGALKNRIACKLVVEKGLEGSLAHFE